MPRKRYGKLTPKQRLKEIAKICERASRVCGSMHTRWNYALKESDCDHIWNLVEGSNLQIGE